MKGTGGDEACKREAAEAEAHELARGQKRSRGRGQINTIGLALLLPQKELI